MASVRLTPKEVAESALQELRTGVDIQGKDPQSKADVQALEAEIRAEFAQRAPKPGQKATLTQGEECRKYLAQTRGVGMLPGPLTPAEQAIAVAEWEAERAALPVGAESADAESGIHVRPIS